MIAYGPVPSRRLGRSLGINNVPPKHCSYACVYCQVGPTTDKALERRSYHEPGAIVKAVREHLAVVGSGVDYLSFVPDGEPTLDANLGRTIEQLRELCIPVAVISNASLLTLRGVREDLRRADWVSLKVDSVDERTWKRINRPNHYLELGAILRGIQSFAESYAGEFVTETMLVRGLNDDEANVEQVADFIATIHPKTAYVSIPTRPPAVRTVESPDAASVNRAYQVFAGKLPGVEYLTGYEGNAFAASGDFERDLLSITAVHPLRESAVRELCQRDHATWDRLESLLSNQQLQQVDYAGERFYVRKWKWDG